MKKENQMYIANNRIKLKVQCPKCDRNFDYDINKVKIKCPSCFRLSDIEIQDSKNYATLPLFFPLGLLVKKLSEHREVIIHTTEFNMPKMDLIVKILENLFGEFLEKSKPEYKEVYHNKRKIFVYEIRLSFSDLFHYYKGRE